MKTTPIQEPYSRSMQSLIDLLFDEQASCVIRSGDTIRILRKPGISDLHKFYTEEPTLLNGARIADKVVGKGAAALMILGGVEELFADVVSYPALELLAHHRIKVNYSIAVDHILNRTQSGWCPIEKLCKECETPEECLSKIEGFIATQS